MLDVDCTFVALIFWAILFIVAILVVPHVVLASEAPNHVSIVRERNAAEADAYVLNAAQSSVHRAAAKLWNHGVPMSKALKIVRAAVSQS